VARSDDVKAQGGAMGRRKIDIVRIENERHRQVTFTKRKSGLIKKATELAILCDAQVGIVIFGANQKMSLYASTSMDDIISRYRDHADTPEVFTTEDYFRDRARKAAGFGGGAGGDGSDDDDVGVGASAMHPQHHLPCAATVCSAPVAEVHHGSYVCMPAMPPGVQPPGVLVSQTVQSVSGMAGQAYAMQSLPPQPMAQQPQQPPSAHAQSVPMAQYSHPPMPGQSWYLAPQQGVQPLPPKHLQQHPPMPVGARPTTTSMSAPPAPAGQPCCSNPVGSAPDAAPSRRNPKNLSIRAPDRPPVVGTREVTASRQVCVMPSGEPDALPGAPRYAHPSYVVMNPAGGATPTSEASADGLIRQHAISPMISAGAHGAPGAACGASSLMPCGCSCHPACMVPPGHGKTASHYPPNYQVASPVVSPLGLVVDANGVFTPTEQGGTFSMLQAR